MKWCKHCGAFYTDCECPAALKGDDLDNLLGIVENIEDKYGIDILEDEGDFFE